MFNFQVLDSTMENFMQFICLLDYLQIFVFLIIHGKNLTLNAYKKKKIGYQFLVFLYDGNKNCSTLQFKSKFEI